jgi:hypothetical protein
MDAIIAIIMSNEVNPNRINKWNWGDPYIVFSFLIKNFMAICHEKAR